MKNLYDGVVVLDNKGKAEIELPDWFGILNKDFRYQLTAIGSPGPNLYIAEEISDMATILIQSTVVTSGKKQQQSLQDCRRGIRYESLIAGNSHTKDPWANANRIEVEEDKPDKERGYYLHPDVYG